MPWYAQYDELFDWSLDDIDEYVESVLQRAWRKNVIETTAVESSNPNLPAPKT